MIKKLTVFAVAFVATFCFISNVDAVTFDEGNSKVSYSYTFGNNAFMYPAAFTYGLHSVKRIRVEVASGAGADYKINILHNAGQGYDVNQLASTTVFALKKDKKNIVEFVHTGGSCSSDATCITVSHSMPGTSSTYVGVTVNQTGIQFVKSGLFGTLRANANVTYYV